MKETGTGRGLVTIDEYERYVGAETVERIGDKAHRMSGMQVVSDMFGSFVTSFSIDPSKVRRAGDGGCT